MPSYLFDINLPNQALPGIRVRPNLTYLFFSFEESLKSFNWVQVKWFCNPIFFIYLFDFRGLDIKSYSDWELSVHPSSNENMSIDIKAAIDSGNRFGVKLYLYLNQF